MRKSRKLIAVLATLALLATLLVPMVGPAAAATNMWCPNVKAVTDGTQTEIGSLFIDIDPGILSRTDESMEIKLPSDVDLIGTVGKGTANDPAKEIMVVAPVSVGGDANAINNLAWLTATKDTNKLTITLDASNANFSSLDTYLRIYFNKVDIESGFEGEIKATVTSPTNFPAGSVVLANCGGGEAEIAIDDVNVVTESGDALEDITIEENVGGAVKDEQETIELTLPKGFEWSNLNITGAWGFSGHAVVNAIPTPGQMKIGWTLSTDKDTLKLHLGKKSTDKGRIIIKAKLDIDETEADLGDVEVELSGATDVKPDTLVVAKYAEYGATVKEGTVAEVFAGRSDAKINEFYIEENSAGSLYEGRSINLTLPSWARWPGNINDVKYTVDDGNIVLGDKKYVDDERHILKIKVDTKSTSASTIKFKKDTKIELAPNAKGDLEIEVSGTAGVSGKVKVATVKAPVTITASATPDVKIGMSGQAAGELTITEVAAGALMEKEAPYDGKLKLELPPGVVYTSLPKVEVTEGNVDLGTVTTEAKDDETNRVLVIPVNSESTKASTIKISNIKLTLFRTVPEGPVTVKVKGDAVQKTSKDRTCTAPYVESDEWMNLTTVVSANNAVVTTPAPGELKAKVVFKIGDAKYTVNGVEQTLDVAPYIKDGRTFIPVRYAAQACGVTPENILFSEGKVTLIKGDKVIQLTIGSNVMLINGTGITMDVKAEIKDGRTMLPFRWVAQALGAKVTWDEATQTVTMEL